MDCRDSVTAGSSCYKHPSADGLASRRLLARGYTLRVENGAGIAVADRGPGEGLRRGFDRGQGAQGGLPGVSERGVRGDHGSFGVGEEHALAHPRRPGQAYVRAGDRRGDRALGALGQEAHAPQAGADGLRVPVLQPHPDALGRGERALARAHRRQEAGQIRREARRAPGPRGAYGSGGRTGRTSSLAASSSGSR